MHGPTPRRRGRVIAIVAASVVLGGVLGGLTLFMLGGDQDDEPLGAPRSGTSPAARTSALPSETETSPTDEPPTEPPLPTRSPDESIYDSPNYPYNLLVYRVDARPCLNVRTRPSTDAPVKRCVDDGEEVYVAEDRTKRADGITWRYVLFDAARRRWGWAAVDFMRFEG